MERRDARALIAALAAGAALGLIIPRTYESARAWDLLAFEGRQLAVLFLIATLTARRAVGAVSGLLFIAALQAGLELSHWSGIGDPLAAQFLDANDYVDVRQWLTAALTGLAGATWHSDRGLAGGFLAGLLAADWAGTSHGIGGVLETVAFVQFVAGLSLAIWLGRRHPPLRVLAGFVVPLALISAPLLLFEPEAFAL